MLSKTAIRATKLVQSACGLQGIMLALESEMVLGAFVTMFKGEQMRLQSTLECYLLLFFLHSFGRVCRLHYNGPL